MPEETEDRPYIEPPDQQELSGELVCWLNAERPCDATCMSYTTQAAESSLLNEQQKHCVVLVAMDRLGRYSGAVAKIMRDTKADISRAAVPAPMEPR